jgi:hypothetical protein
VLGNPAVGDPKDIDDRVAAVAGIDDDVNVGDDVVTVGGS